MSDFPDSDQAVPRRRDPWFYAAAGFIICMAFVGAISIGSWVHDRFSDSTAPAAPRNDQGVGYELVRVGEDEVPSACDWHGHRVFYSAVGAGRALAVIDDPSCPIDPNSDGGPPR